MLRYYQQLQAAAEGRGILSADWRSVAGSVLRDAQTMYRDRVRGGDKSVMDLLSSAIAKAHLQRGGAAMAADKSFYLRYVLPPPLDSLAYYAGIVKQAYVPKRGRSGTALGDVGIQQPVANLVDDKIEQEFLLYLFTTVGEAPSPYTRGGKLTKQWRAYVRRTFKDFLCRRVGVDVSLSGACHNRP